MINDDWIPAKEDVEWTKEHINRMQIGDTWGVADAVMRKDDDNLLTVLKLSPASVIPLGRIGKVCAEFGVSVDTENAELVHDPEHAAQESAKEWTCTECDERIVNFNLDDAEWVLLDEEQEAWRVMVSHETKEGEEHGVALSPMDYHLVAGDDLFFSWRGMRVLERHEIIDLADNGELYTAMGDETIIIMPTRYNDELIPPHLRGLVFHTSRDEEE